MWCCQPGNISNHKINNDRDHKARSISCVILRANKKAQELISWSIGDVARPQRERSLLQHTSSGRHIPLLGDGQDVCRGRGVREGGCLGWVGQDSWGNCDGTASRESRQGVQDKPGPESHVARTTPWKMGQDASSLQWRTGWKAGQDSSVCPGLSAKGHQ